LFRGPARVHFGEWPFFSRILGQPVFFTTVETILVRFSLEYRRFHSRDSIAFRSKNVREYYYRRSSSRRTDRVTIFRIFRPRPRGAYPIALLTESFNVHFPFGIHTLWAWNVVWWTRPFSTRFRNSRRRRRRRRRRHGGVARTAHMKVSSCTGSESRRTVKPRVKKYGSRYFWRGENFFFGST